ncbi:HET-domain-containing protein [Hyaloscypha variabilis F]|uniref:HET-domain-containing protein n=1 Tax=Hyaloscypha variabilis (strain UAMH 11265 / GT02V1 / F) TaxID=1149755 RepID=A0A2J6RWP4_HYAVF|nr:HET-domain-containing protein [Hyaloscypha variabilis F]
MSTYQYQPLGADVERGIRLVNLLPGQFDDEVQVQILHTSLSLGKSTLEDLSYEALSYVWGPESNPAIITIRDRKSRCIVDSGTEITSYISEAEAETLSIRRNLDVALRHLRKSSESRILWIDAICINQQDVEERNREVGRMGQIYGNATRVLIWLGPEGENSSLAVRSLRLFAEDLTDEFVKDYFSRRYRAPGSRTELLLASPIPWFDEGGHWLAIRRLFYRKWFTRLWVYQECHLADDVLVIVGFDTISLPELVRAGLWFAEACSKTHDFEGAQRLAASLNIIRPRSASRVMDVISRTRGCECEDPRDRIYAIMELFPNHIKYDLHPDYRLPVEVVYKDFFLAYLRDFGGMNFIGLSLTYNRWTHSSKSIPSWVPDLASPVRPLQFGLACGKSEHAVGYSSTNDILRVNGIQIAKLSSVQARLALGASHKETLEYCAANQPEDSFKTTYVDGRTVLAAFTEMLVCGSRGKLLGIDFPSSEQLGEEYLQFSTSGKQLSPLFLYQMSTFLPGRAFFTADSGYIGTCLPTAVPGDIVCLVLGFQFPLVLHPIPGEPGLFELRGECYVPGLMESQGLLGPVPRGWGSYRLLTARPWGHLFTDGRVQTQNDPRLPPLPAGWRVKFQFGDVIQDDEYDSDGNIGEIRFVNEKEGKVQWHDPRLAPEALKSRGVKIEEMFIK